MGEKSDSRQLVNPPEMLARSNASIMFRAIFGHREAETSEFEEKRDELLKFVFWCFANATATNLADYVPWLKMRLFWVFRG